jgi:hypothetical protein
MALCTCYIATPFVFPVLLCGTAFGFCKLSGNISAVSAGIIVELPPPEPMVIMTVLSIISMFMALLLKVNIE